VTPAGPVLLVRPAVPELVPETQEERDREYAREPRHPALVVDRAKFNHKLIAASSPHLQVKMRSRVKGVLSDLSFFWWNCNCPYYFPLLSQMHIL
jgi:hypothetical protein